MATPSPSPCPGSDRPARRSLALALILATAALAAPAPRGGGQTSISISPLLIEVSGRPGKAVRDAVLIQNDEAAPAQVRARADDWSVGRDGGLVYPDRSPSPLSCRGWVRIEDEDRVLGAGRSESFRFSVQVPAGAEPGTYWAALAFDVAPPEGGNRSGQGLLLRQSLMTGVFVNVGKAKPQAELADLALDRSKTPPEARLTVRNTGRAFFRASGRIDTLDAAGKRLGSREIPPELVLPGGERELKVPLAEAPPAGGSLRAVVEAPSLRALEITRQVVE